MKEIKRTMLELIDAADILIHRRDDMIDSGITLVLSKGVTRLEHATAKAQNALRRLDEREKIIYLASPYSHDDPRVREERYRQACYTTAALMRRGLLVYSPIVHSHPLTRYGLPTTWDYWRTLDEAMLSRCHELMVLTLDGWEDSEGIMAEIRLAKKFGLHVSYTGLGNPLRYERAMEAVRRYEDGQQETLKE